MTARIDVAPKTTEQNRIVRIGNSKAEVINNKNCARVIVLLKLTTDRHEASRDLFSTAELLAHTQRAFDAAVNFNSIE